MGEPMILGKRCWTEIKLSTIVNSYQTYKNQSPKNVNIMSVVKADDVAQVIGSLGYEVVCNMPLRVERCFFNSATRDIYKHTFIDT